jgi:molybdate transport system regulatory protein
MGKVEGKTAIGKTAVGKTVDGKTGARLRVVLGKDVALGPGKADLLRGIAETGSIAAAGRRMGMSYKRAWQLVDALNGFFTGPVVAAGGGGAAGGGARLTPLGVKVLARFEAMAAATDAAVAADLAVLRRLLRK